MGKLNINGIDELMLDFADLSDLPDSLVSEMLEAEAEEIIGEQKKSAPYRNGDLSGSIKADVVKIDKQGNHYITVRPAGTHHKNKDGKAVTNAELGFIYEYGAPQKGIKARQWMRKANEKAAPRAVAAAERVYNEFIDKMTK